MRTFRDQSGTDWDVVVSRESWGAFYALFVSTCSDGGKVTIRKALLEPVAQAEATRMLMDLNDEGLRGLFEGAEQEAV